jgi:FixJ family two-component response regulator
VRSFELGAEVPHPLDYVRYISTLNGGRLLFTDIRMPGSCDGMDLARKVHARRPQILLVLTSGHARPAQAEIPDRGRFVSKPYREKDLLDEVRDLMR